MADKHDSWYKWSIIGVLVFVVFFTLSLFFEARRQIDEIRRGEEVSKKLTIKHPLRWSVVYSIKRHGALCVPEDGGPEIWVSIPNVANLSEGSRFILKGEGDNWDDAFTIIERGDK